VVEDDSAIRDTLCEVLISLGYEASSCSNGRDALDYLRRERHPDVILLDLMLPVMSGWEFRVEQRKDPALTTIPVVVLSADGTPKAAAIDADAYLEKPVSYETLACTVERVVLRHENRVLQTRLIEADRLTSLGTLAAGVAHEINNPLSYVLLNVSFVMDKLEPLLVRGGDLAFDELARSPQLKKDLLDALTNAQLGTERIRTIVRGLRTFSRPEDDPHTALDVRSLLDSTLAMLEHEIRPKARLVKQYDDVPCVDANEARLAQVFLNLLLNATQALDDHADGNEILVRVRSCPPKVVVEIHDTGCGIPDDVRGRVFEPFFTTKPLGVGTGLGLSICHGIVRSLDGELTFDTQTGGGTVFRVTLPAGPRGG
jgi:signal transduction histidine kinase